MKILITTCSALALAATLSLAQDKPAAPPPGAPPGGGEGRPRPNPEEAFKKLDANSDGSVTLDEFKAGPRAQQNPERAEGAFKRMDKDSDGKLTLEEFKSGRPPGGPGGVAVAAAAGRRQTETFQPAVIRNPLQRIAAVLPKAAALSLVAAASRTESLLNGRFLLKRVAVPLIRRTISPFAAVAV